MSTTTATATRTAYITRKNTVHTENCSTLTRMIAPIDGSSFNITWRETDRDEVVALLISGAATALSECKACTKIREAAEKVAFAQELASHGIEVVTAELDEILPLAELPTELAEAVEAQEAAEASQDVPELRVELSGDSTQAVEALQVLADEAVEALPIGTNEKKRIVAQLVMRAVGDLLENWDEMGDDRVDVEDARTYAAIWMNYTSGKGWDTRLGPIGNLKV